MKKELKRYFLAKYVNSNVKIFDSYDEYLAYLKVIKKENRKRNAEYVSGNISCKKIRDKYYVEAPIYYLFSKKSELSVLDNYTSFVNDDRFEFIRVMYFNDRKDELDIGISSIPVLNHDDVKYLNKEYFMRVVRHCLEHDDYNYFYKLVNSFSCYKIIKNELISIMEEINKDVIDKTKILILMSNLYDNFVRERDSKDKKFIKEKGEYLKSHRRVRDICLFTKHYSDKYIKSEVESINEENMEDTRQEELSTYLWDKQNGDTYDEFDVEYNHDEHKIILK